MSKRTRIGHLNRRIDIEEATATRGQAGQELLTWSCLATVWAAVNAGNTGNAEQVEGDQLVATSRLVFTIRYRAGLDKKMRVKYRDNLYNILTIHDDGRDAYMHLTCQIQE